MTNEELLKDYLEYALPDINGDGVHTYLDKQTLERVVVDDAMIDKAKVAFIERLEKRRSKEVLIKEEKKVAAPQEVFPPGIETQEELEALKARLRE